MLEWLKCRVTRTQRGLRFGWSRPREADDVTRHALGQQRDIGADDAGRDGVATSGLVVGQEHDRLAIARHLHTSER